MQRGCILLAKNGFVVLTYDPIGQGERSQLLDKLGHPAIKGSTSEHTMCGIGALLVGRGTASYRVWDGIRSLDCLASRPEVDAKKLGCTGCSGGGTLTSYLMALDDRIQAAAPSCYVTSLERLFATIGPQDAEQNVTGQVAFGMDHADYVFMRAPKPTLICAATKDFFDIQGTWDTFREAKRVYGRLGFAERIDLMESEGGHGYPKSHREAVARFMSRWLKGDDRAIVEGDFPIEKDNDLLCTRSGQVLEDLKGKSVFDLNAASATELAKKRTPQLLERAALHKVVGRVLGLPNGEPEFGIASNPQDQPNPGNDDPIRKLIFNSNEPSVTPFTVPLPALLFARNAKEQKPIPLVVYVHDRGKAAGAGPDGAIESLLKSGKNVLAVDLRGWGETAPGVVERDNTPVFGIDSKEAFLSLHLNRSLPGQRVWDLLGVVARTPRWADGKVGVELVGVGSAAVTVLHVAAFDDRIKAATIENCLPSWDLVVRTPIGHNQLANVVPGALAVYDLPDLAASIAPRPLTIRNPVDAMGQPLSKEAAEEAYKAVRAAYKDAGAADKLTIDTRSK
jgi:dienelactone hydrolase